MSLNCNEIEKIIEHFPNEFYIKSIVQDDKNSIYIIPYEDGGKKVFCLDAEDSYNFISYSQLRRLPKGKLRFAQSLDSLLKGAKVTNVRQYDYSRVVIFDIKGNNDYKLIVRMWNTGSNILLLDKDDVIIDCLKRFSAKYEWPGEAFELPVVENADELKNRFKIRDEFDTPTINEIAYQTFYTKKRDKKLATLKNKLLKHFDTELSKVNKSLKELDKSLTGNHDEKYKHYGDLITANIYKIEKGMSEVVLEDYNTGEDVKVKLDPLLSAAENREKYYKKYKKVKNGRVHLEEQKEILLSRIEDLETFINNVELCEHINELKSIEKEIKPDVDNKNSSKKLKFGRKFNLSNGYVAFVSRNAKEADIILKRVAKGNDYWFHIRDYAGSHVVVKNMNNMEIPDVVKKEGAMLALHYSKAKKASDGDIYFTRVKYLHKPNTNTPGLVFPTQEKNIKIEMDDKILKKVLSSVES